MVVFEEVLGLFDSLVFWAFVNGNSFAFEILSADASLLLRLSESDLPDWDFCFWFFVGIRDSRLSRSDLTKFSA